MADAGRLTRHLRITGLVQGVGYRMSMVAAASRIGVAGWVRNRHDGSVEAMVEGTADQIEAITAWARQGPRSARVDTVEVTPGEGGFSGFNALHDA